MKTLIWSNLNPQQQKDALSRPSISTGAQIIERTQAIIDDVRKNGDTALAKYTEKFEGIRLSSLKVEEAEIANAEDKISTLAKKAIDTAFDNICAFHKKQGYQPYDLETTKGIQCGRRVRAYNSVGLYVPGGSAPLISTTLMIGIPAMLAGCKNKVMCTPCDKDGNVNPHILYAAHKCNIRSIIKTGGAQAITAMAYGTDDIIKCDKIFGPGNAYVTAAKSIVSKDPNGAAIDMPAGPSEVLVITDETTPADFATADLLSQAEHDPMSQVILLSTDHAKINEIMAALNKQIQSLPRKDIAAQAIENSRAILVSDINEAIAVSNIYAPEHLILCFDNADQYEDSIQNAGSVFVGPYSCESAGDYASGTNHVLPTYGYANHYSGLNVEAFQKTITFQTLSPEGLENLGDTIETLAEIEGLDAHKRAVSIRRQK